MCAKCRLQCAHLVTICSKFEYEIDWIFEAVPEQTLLTAEYLLIKTTWFPVSFSLTCIHLCNQSRSPHSNWFDAEANRKRKKAKSSRWIRNTDFFFWHHACSRLLSLHEQPTREIPGKHLNRFKLKIVRNVTRCRHNKYAGDRYNGWSARCECVAEHNRQSTIKRVSSWRSAKATLWIAYAQHYKRDRDKLDVLCVLCRPVVKWQPSWFQSYRAGRK